MAHHGKHLVHRVIEDMYNDILFSCKNEMGMIIVFNFLGSKCLILYLICF